MKLLSSLSSHSQHPQSCVAYTTLHCPVNKTGHCWVTLADAIKGRLSTVVIKRKNSLIKADNLLFLIQTHTHPLATWDNDLTEFPVCGRGGGVVVMSGPVKLTSLTSLVRIYSDM